jgi:hypothetical protein
MQYSEDNTPFDSNSTYATMEPEYRKLMQNYESIDELMNGEFLNPDDIFKYAKGNELNSDSELRKIGEWMKI